ncbi:DNA helicase IV [Vibrio breoganii]|uniref:DNA helicase IV n=1 Tax=Vibrio breoganii TaxID=553239 RepID=UPI000C831274|nr:DNA helicase IV [Vibrio breoganii]PMG35430.1 DNA helicase IV [Vibrio breoganii]PMG84678.1 DNA helicase IV [Vibrio breoganii]PML32538.1 DNA helicase IV [Vibrio breoganii]PML81051.1 DNA helicase IV [Vibrio breoganii]PMO94416.1 DNA helicase IV [Vibrio breoganii]
MQLQATPSARFFLQDEYFDIKLEKDQLVLTSRENQTSIPFSEWSGKTAIERGLVWGSITFYGYQQQQDDEAVQNAWQIQGLSWGKAKSFGRTAVQYYEKWHRLQCRQLNLYLPKWQQKLQLLRQKPAYLAHSEWRSWQEMVHADLEEMNISLNDANQRMPENMQEVNQWLCPKGDMVKERNELWLTNETQNWQVLFAQIENSPLNASQQKSVLLNNDHNLILAGAGTGKTSVLMARVAYLLQSHQAQAEDVALLAFGKDAATEMSQRLSNKIGVTSQKVNVSTFHKMALHIIQHVEGSPAKVSSLASESKQKQQWCAQWLKEHWTNATNFKRWQKHLSQWPIAYLKGDVDLGSQFENPKLIAWLDQQLDQLCSMSVTKKSIQQQIIEHPEYSRLNSELQLVWPCYQAWKQYLKEQGELDFHSMIEKATQYVSKNRFKAPWRYLMVDEYQDISPARLALVEAIVNQPCEQGRRSLFAVGDDWQSIYQFAGSDVNLTTGFLERFPDAATHHLDTTYRFNSQIADVAGEFILQNPLQLTKTLTAHKQQKQKAVSVVVEAKLEKTLQRVNNTHKPLSVLVLGRTHKDKPSKLQQWQSEYSNLEFNFMTCHSSKGKEADVVLLMGVNEHNFPQKERAPHLDVALKSSNESFPFAEERRLFYVALTRAKQEAIVSYDLQPSPFITELLEGSYAVKKK